MKKTYRLALLVAAALPASCVYEPPMAETDASALPMLSADRGEPRLALAEHLLAGYFTSDIAAPPTVCLAVSDGVASDGQAQVALPAEQETALIARFPTLAPFARCTWSDGLWRDAATEEPALVFTIHSFSCASDTACEGWASYTAGAVASASELWRMRYESGRWQFERDRRLIAQ